MPEVDGDLDDEMEIGGRGGHRENVGEWDDGMDFKMNM